MRFCVAIVILNREENEQHFQFYYFKKGKNATETQKKTCAGYGEGVRLIECVKSGFRSSLLELSRWRMLLGRADQLKLTAIKLRQ